MAARSCSKPPIDTSVCWRPRVTKDSQRKSRSCGDGEPILHALPLRLRASEASRDASDGGWTRRPCLGHRRNSRSPPVSLSAYSCTSSGYASRRKNSKERSRKNSGRAARSSKSCTSARPKGGVMEDEWTRVMCGDRLVKFTYVDLPEGPSFLTAQIAGHDVVYSVILRQSEHPFNREGVERHFAVECPPLSN